MQPASHSFGTILNTSITESADAIIRVALYMMLASIWMHMLDQIILTDSVGKTILLSTFEITTGLELLSGYFAKHPLSDYARADLVWWNLFHSADHVHDSKIRT